MNFSEYQQAIIDDISVLTTDAFYTTALIKRAINRAYKWVAGLRNWPQTEETYKVNSRAGVNYYNYPSDFKTDSIKELYYNGKEYTKTLWREYRRYLKDNPTGTDKIFSDLKRQYHINENVALETITFGIEITGNIAKPTNLVNDSDTTLFYGDTNIEEAILKKSLAILYKKARGQMYDKGVALEEEAKTLVADAWDQIMKSQGDYKSGQGVVFNQIDILPTSRNARRSSTGNFSIRTR